MSDELTIADRALVRTTYDEEPKPDREPCKFPGCPKRATRQDGRCARHSGYRLTNAAMNAATKHQMERAQAFYLEQHKIATKKAAEQGDAKPAQWALEKLKVVAPPESKDTGGPRVTVVVGGLLPGLREGQ
jgi:hypothetical protein